MRKKPITVILLSFSILLVPLLADEAANPTAKLLREALFAEQADRDIAKAEKGYREIIKNFESDRAYAATAILRLAEILHQRGDTAAAEKWFARVLQEFPDQEEIAKVARTRLGDKAPDLLDARRVRANPQTEAVDRIKKLLKESPDLLDTPIDGTTLLTTAASKGQLEVIEFLLDRGARVNPAGNSLSPLASAVENGHLAVVTRLLKAEAKLEPNLLIKSVRSGNYAISELLLKAGANPNTANSLHLTQKEFMDSSSPIPIPIFSSDEIDDPFGGSHHLDRKPESVSGPTPLVWWTPLEITTFSRFAKLTDLLLANGAKSHKADGEFSEGLRFAIIDQNTKLVAKLLKNGADPNSYWRQPPGRISALATASALGNAEIVTQLIEAGANLNATESNDGKTPLYFANEPTVATLLAAGADPNAKNRYGETLLHRATDPAKVKALLAAGANPNALDMHGFSPITHAHPEVFDVLLATKPDLTKFEGPHTVLGHVSGGRKNPTYVERIKKLIAAGADPNQVDKESMTPLLIAVSSFNAECVEALLAGGANPNGVPNSQAPLSIFPPANPKNSSKYGPVVRALVEAGANPNVLDSNNETVLRKAAAANDLETVRYLLEKGAALQLAGKFAFSAARDVTITKSELFLATYLQAERRRGTIRIVTPDTGRIHEEVSAFVPGGKELPECPYSILEAYANCDENFFSFGEVTIWREGKAEPMKFNLRKIIASSDPAQDFELAWGDVIQLRAAKSEVEIAVSETERKFLDSYLKRVVKFNFHSGIKEIELGLDWNKQIHTENWVRRNYRKFNTLNSDYEKLPLVPLQSINLVIGDTSSGSADHWIVERKGGQKIEIPIRRSGNLWLEPGDTVGYKFNKP